MQTHDFYLTAIECGVWIVPILKKVKVARFAFSLPTLLLSWCPKQFSQEAVWPQKATCNWKILRNDWKSVSQLKSLRNDWNSVSQKFPIAGSLLWSNSFILQILHQLINQLPTSPRLPTAEAQTSTVASASAPAVFLQTSFSILTNFSQQTNAWHYVANSVYQRPPREKNFFLSWSIISFFNDNDGFNRYVSVM